jgi:hypothetical protein
VLSGLGMERLEGMLPEIISSTASPKSYVREGFISLLVYLPATFGHRFAPHLGRVIPPILNGLADDSEYGESPSNVVVVSKLTMQSARLRCARGR